MLNLPPRPHELFLSRCPPHLLVCRAEQALMSCRSLPASAGRCWNLLQRPLGVWCGLGVRAARGTFHIHVLSLASANTRHNFGGNRSAFAGLVAQFRLVCAARVTRCWCAAAEGSTLAAFSPCHAPAGLAAGCCWTEGLGVTFPLEGL